MSQMRAPDPRPPAVPVSERDAYTLLASANLLRMRGRWDEAVEKCMAAMRLAPDSATAQSLLGDIYENQGRLDDAIQWYRMALDVNPDSPADKIKLERLLQSKASLLSAPSPMMPPVTVATERKRRVEPDFMLRLAAFAAALLALAVVALALLVTARRGPIHLADGALRQFNTNPIVLNPAAAAPAIAPAPSASPSNRDPLEQNLLDRLRAAPEFAEDALILTDLQSDPRAARMTVTFSIRPPSSGGATREFVLRQSLRALQTVAREVDPQTATLFTVRCLLAPSPYETALSTPLVFVGDVSRSSLPATEVVPATLAAPQMLSLFQEIWWSPLVPS